MRIVRSEATPAMLGETICLALWREAGGREGKSVSINDMEDFRALVDGIGIAGVTTIDVRNGLARIVRSSWAERAEPPMFENGYGGKYRTTAVTRARAKHAADALQTVLMPPPAPKPKDGLPEHPGRTDNNEESNRVIETQQQPGHSPSPDSEPACGAGASVTINALMDVLVLAESAQEDRAARRAAEAEMERLRNNPLGVSGEHIRQAALQLQAIAYVIRHGGTAGVVLQSLSGDLPCLNPVHTQFVGCLADSLFSVIGEVGKEEGAPVKK